MKSIFAPVLVAVTIFGLSIPQVLAQSEPDGENGIPPTHGTILQSEEEIWEYLEQLCIEAPTRRCQTMEFMVVRYGEALPMEEYDVTDAYRSKVELIDAARNRIPAQE